MLRDSEKEKLQLEHDAAKLFMRLYEQQFAIPMRHIWHNEPSKPDVSCYLGETRLDLEIAHLYASETEAMALLGRPLSVAMQRDIAAMAQTPDCDHLSQALTRLLKQKFKKSYHSERVWLVVRNASPLWHRADLAHVLSELHLPPQQPFEQIWLICDFFGKEGLCRM
ncbi:hypothetical protein ACFOEE_14380 [Pseudoalteromonas fenneropenaei]|uniref:Uncharacterized protein n=1 Tax=Pseudoalteromonas fenneropenaei TaxID=1737459 RepID=A0ABV7CME9_9GAMM